MSTVHWGADRADPLALFVPRAADDRSVISNDIGALDGRQGRIVRLGNGGSNTFFDIPSAGSAQDWRLCMEMRQSPAATGDPNLDIFITTRSTGAGATEPYGATVRLVRSPSTGNVVSIHLLQHTSAGAYTGFGQTAIPPQSANDIWYLEIEAVGSTLRARAWSIGEETPTTWTASATLVGAVATQSGPLVLAVKVGAALIKNISIANGADALPPKKQPPWVMGVTAYNGTGDCKYLGAGFTLFGNIRKNGRTNACLWQGGQWSDTTLHSWGVADVHNDANFCECSDGAVLAVYTDHESGPIYFRKSTAAPASGFLSWGSETSLSTATNARYPRVVATDHGPLNHRIWLFYNRDTDNSREVFYRTSDDDGATWSAEVKLWAKASGEYLYQARCYYTIHSDGHNLIFASGIGYPHDRPGYGSGNGPGYVLRYRDGEWRAPNGTITTLPAWTDTVHASAKAFDPITAENYGYESFFARDEAGDIILYLNGWAGATDSDQPHMLRWTSGGGWVDTPLPNNLNFIIANKASNYPFQCIGTEVISGIQQQVLWASLDEGATWSRFFTLTDRSAVSAQDLGFHSLTHDGWAIYREGRRNNSLNTDWDARFYLGASNISTLDTTPPVLTGDITIDATSSSSIAFSWPAASDNIAVLGYEISTDGGSSWTAVGNVLSTTASGLAAATSYPLRVRAVDWTGDNVSTPPLAISQATEPVLFSVTDAGGIPSTSAVGAPLFSFDLPDPGFSFSITEAGGIPSTSAVGTPTFAFDFPEPGFTFSVTDAGGIPSTAAVGAPVFSFYSAGGPPQVPPQRRLIAVPDGSTAFYAPDF